MAIPLPILYLGLPMSYNRIRYLPVDELNERLEELLAFKSTLEDAQTELSDLAKDETNEDAEAQQSALEDAQNAVDAAELNFGTAESAELAKLEELRDDIGSKGDLIDDENGPFIHENDFKEYAQELADDIGAIDPKAGWPLNCIDWDQAAKELAYDYTSVQWDGDTYLYRS